MQDYLDRPTAEVLALLHEPTKNKVEVPIYLRLKFLGTLGQRNPIAVLEHQQIHRSVFGVDACKVDLIHINDGHGVPAAIDLNTSTLRPLCLCGSIICQARNPRASTSYSLPCHRNPRSVALGSNLPNCGRASMPPRPARTPKIDSMMMLHHAPLLLQVQSLM